MGESCPSTIFEHANGYLILLTVVDSGYCGPAEVFILIHKYRNRMWESSA